MAKYPPFHPEDDEQQLAGFLLLLDEVDHLLPSGGPNLQGWRYRAIELGRHEPVAIVANCRRPQATHRTLRSYATDVYVGRLGSGLDIDHAVKEWGEACSVAGDLPPFRFVHVCP